MLRPLALIVLLTLCACTRFPEVDARVSDEARAAPYPKLVSIDALNARARGISIDEGVTRSVQARVAALQARARLLRGAPVDDETRARLAAARR